MKTKQIITVLFCLTTNLLFAQSNATIDAKSSIINWTGHAEIGPYAPAGTLSFKEGQATISNGAIKSARFVIDMKSMKQENENLLKHLKSDDFFDVEKYPSSIINIEKVTDGEVYGQLTIKDKMQRFHCPVSIRKDNNHYIVSGKATIDRISYGIIYNSGNFFSGLGDKAIKNTFDIAFTIVLIADDQP